MIKAKPFQFLISNAAGDSSFEDEKEIDKKINAWIEKENAEVISLNVTSYAGGPHLVVGRVYTILYRETKQEA